MPRRRRRANPEALAHVVLERYLCVRRGTPVTVESWSHALPWARALVVEARRRGARPTLLVEDEEAYFRSLAVAAPVAVRFRPPLPARGGAYVRLDGPSELPRLAGLVPRDRERLLLRHDRRWWAEARRLRLRAVRLAVADATAAAADRFGVDRDAWEDELVRASILDPRRLARQAERVALALGRARRLEVRHSNGTDFTTVRGDGRTVRDTGVPDPSAGRVWSRIPAGLFIVPLRASGTDGTWEMNRPHYDRFVDPPVAVGGRFAFHGGRITTVTFDRGGEPFSDALARTGRGRLRPLALTVGLNPAIGGAPELAPLAEGTVGIVLGDASLRADGSDLGFSFVAPLADADVDADGRAWLRGGRPTRPRSTRVGTV